MAIHTHSTEEWSIYTEPEHSYQRGHSLQIREVADHVTKHVTYHISSSEGGSITLTAAQWDALFNFMREGA